MKVSDHELAAINLLEEVKKIETLYYYEKIGTLNSHALTVVNVSDRTLDFHKHEYSDELFFVIDGAFYLEVKNEKDDGLAVTRIPIGAGELIIVPKGVLHRPVVTTLTRFLMMELEGTLTKENSGDLYES